MSAIPRRSLPPLQGAPLSFTGRRAWVSWAPGTSFVARTSVAPSRSSSPAAKPSVPRLIIVSSPSVGYESVPTAGAGAAPPITRRQDGSWYSESKAEAELVALAARAPDRAVTAIRPHAIWGPGDTQLVGRIVDRARSGRLFLVGGGRALIDTTYVDNAADALVAATEQLAVGGPLDGRAFVVTNGEPLPVRLLLERICAAAGVPPPRRNAPRWLARRAAGGVERAWTRAHPGKEPPATRFLVDQLAFSHWFDPRPFREATGWRPAVSIDEGMRRLAHSYEGCGLTKQLWSVEPWSGRPRNL